MGRAGCKPKGYEPTTGEKLLWFLVIFFLYFIGALIYFVVRRSHRMRF
jgi:hypothetical protein